MDFQGSWLKVITFLFYLESWNPASKILNKKWTAWCSLLGFPADQALLLPCPVGTVAWLPTSAFSFLSQRLKVWLKYLDFFVVLSVQAVPKETLQSKGAMAGESGTLEEKWLHCQNSEPITSQEGQCPALKKLQQKPFLQINQLWISFISCYSKKQVKGTSTF